MTEQDIIDLIRKDKWMMDILRAAERLDLPNWWIGAGFVRSKVWDYLSGYKKRTPLPDVDLIYFDPSDFTKDEAGNFSVKSEDKYQERLSRLNSSVKWSVTNQARMHVYHKREPYKNSEEALSEWPETVTCIGVRLEDRKLKLIAPHGIEDLVNLVVRPIPKIKLLYKHDPNKFENRMEEKKWLQKWPKLKIAY